MKPKPGSQEFLEYYKQHVEKHKTNDTGQKLRDFILGGQDGLVNVLGVILGVATATNNVGIVIIAGLAATFAESISMAAVAYTSIKAEKEFYQSEVEREKREIDEEPEMEKHEIREIYYEKGFRGKDLELIVDKITADKKIWLNVMMREELNLSDRDLKNPLNNAIVVGVSALYGSVIPLAPFFFLPISQAIIASLILSLITLFAAGALKAKYLGRNALKSGLELAAIGMTAALVGYAIGAVLGATVI